ncbi:PIG-L family deacetylase [Actinokineospora globicatena]|uniref:GlcNAc-PI de-N-acetylase n=1 Tax=Actinokineospora globicatena TaxID=103729 RepID=A0A9W6QKQ4_9PSEU|nr:PIG-L family deacetylase [Actinokineospora globicatena]GLW90264.1 hypothetical protein Aglo03_10800 [Actinokineospora globicatena]
MKRIYPALFAAVALAVQLTLPAAAAPTATAAPATTAAVTTTITFAPHQDDDLLFMSPDVLSDVQAGYNVWVVYTTAGEIPCDGEGCALEYADHRIQGARAAYARAAHKPNDWNFELFYFNGHELATNRLLGTNIHLVFTFIHAANGEDACGDLARMATSSTGSYQPIDGRAPYTRFSFISTLRAFMNWVQPDYIRTTSSIGHRLPENVREHVDHVASAILVAEADLNAGTNVTRYRRDEYDGYVIATFPDNVSGYWRNEKTAAWDAYFPYDEALPPGSWYNVMGKQYRPEGRVFYPGSRWIPPGDFSC